MLRISLVSACAVSDVRSRMLMTDAHQEPSLTRITPVAGATTAEFERICKHRDRAILMIGTTASILTEAVMP